MKRNISILAVFAAAMMHGGQPSMFTHSPLPWIEMTHGKDNQFPAKAAAALNHNTEKLQTLSPVLPYSVVITNSGTDDLHGICVRYTLTSLQGKEIHYDFSYHAFADPAHPVIPHGESRLFTPLKTTNAIAAGAISAGMRDRDGRELPVLTSDIEKQHIAAVANSPVVHISVDLVVTADGRTAGPDVANTVLKWRQQDDTFLFMRGELLSRTAHGATDQDLINWLTPLSEQSIRRDPNTGMGSRVTSVQRLLANDWLRQIREGNSVRLQQSMLLSVPLTRQFKVGGLK